MVKEAVWAKRAAAPAHVYICCGDESITLTQNLHARGIENENAAVKIEKCECEAKCGEYVSSAVDDDVRGPGA